MIVSLMGPSTAGKSTLAKLLQARHPERFARVPVDFFFVPRPAETTMAAYLASPLHYDWAAVDRALAATGPLRSAPDCDFEQMIRRAEHGGLPIAEAPICLLDGMRPHPRSDRVIMLELEPDLQRRRLINRDARWGTAVAARTAHLAATFTAGCAELSRAPDLSLPAADPPEVNANRIINFLPASADRPPAEPHSLGRQRSR